MSMTPQDPSLDFGTATAVRRRGRRVLRPGQTPLMAALETGRIRLMVAIAVFGLGFLTVAGGLVNATVLNVAERSTNASSIPAPKRRADLLDRNGVPLATSLTTYSLFADPKFVFDPKNAARRLAEVLPDLDPKDVEQRLSNPKARFVWIKRHLTPQQQYAVHELGEPGLDFQTEERRLYPNGALTSHVIGFTSVDNEGLAGVEKGLDDVITGQREPVVLSLDVRLQHILHRELSATVAKFSALGGSAMIMDVRTGEVLAMVSLPDFDPQNVGSATDDQRFNRNTLGVYEMGSTFKIFNTALALDSGTVSLTDKFDATKPVRFGRFTIDDFKPKRGWMTVYDILKNSSNVGSVRVIQTVGVARQQEFMKKLGFLQKPSLEVSDIGAPIYPHNWREINAMTIAFGHGISVTPVHLITGVAAVFNGGHLRQATLLRRPEGRPIAETQILSAQTSKEMRQLMREVVASGALGLAEAKGYLPGGKSGTAEKSVGKRYSKNARRSLFVGAFPMTAPQYAVMVMVDEPQPIKETHGYATGGWVAAPVFGTVVRQMAPLLNIPPVDEDDPAIQHALQLDLAPHDSPASETPPEGSTFASFSADRRRQ